MTKHHHDEQKQTEPKTKAEKIAKLHQDHTGEGNKELDDSQRKSLKSQIAQTLAAHPHVDALFHDDDTVTLLHSHKPDTDPVNLKLDADQKEFADAAEKIAPEDKEAIKQRQAVERGQFTNSDPVAAKADE